MDLEVLCEFAEIARQGSYSRAAEDLHVSQSSLSKHILSLERELGMRLFDRSSRRISLSPGGQKLLPLAQQAQQLQQAIVLLAREERSLRTGLVCLASIPVMAQYGITQAIAAFGRVCPQATLQITEQESRDIPGLLQSGACEMAFTREVQDDPELESLAFCTDTLVAVLPENHPLANRAFVMLDSLRTEDFLLLDADTGLYALCIQLCQGAGFSPKIRYTGHRPENILDLAAAGMGVALLMSRHAAAYACPGIRVLPVEPAVLSNICLVRRRGVRPSRYGRAFWDFIGSGAAMPQPTGE